MINFVSYAVVHTEKVRRDDLICMFVTPSRVFHVTTEWVTLWTREQLIQIALAYRKSMSVMKYRCLQNATS